jgi:hypothetical protein
MRYLQGSARSQPGRARFPGSPARYRTGTLNDEEMGEILTSLERRRVVAAEGGDGVLVSILDEVISELEAGNLPDSLRSDE